MRDAGRGADLFQALLQASTFLARIPEARAEDDGGPDPFLRNNSCTQSGTAKAGMMSGQVDPPRDGVTDRPSARTLPAPD